MIKRLPRVIKTFLSEELQDIPIDYVDVSFMDSDYLEINYDNKIVYEILNKLINVLSHSERNCIYLRYWCNYSFQDIAKYNKISVKRVKQILSQAVKRIRRRQKYIINYL